MLACLIYYQQWIWRRERDFKSFSCIHAAPSKRFLLRSFQGFERSKSDFLCATSRKRVCRSNPAAQGRWCLLWRSLERLKPQENYNWLQSLFEALLDRARREMQRQEELAGSLRQLRKLWKYPQQRLQFGVKVSFTGQLNCPFSNLPTLHKWHYNIIYIYITPDHCWLCIRWPTAPFFHVFPSRKAIWVLSSGETHQHKKMHQKINKHASKNK